ncbi:hypothetical protein [Hymenobacter sp.]|uniref:hypothetical protein n=1 Tax=Hymenobacter sp. TaxID=1898978 RepID=UPI002D7F09A0|nr:hypothetical protein [Hymenobacter sp.]
MMNLIQKQPCRWVLLLAASRCLAAQAQLPAGQPAPRPTGPITISGTAIDDSLNVPIPDLWLYLNDTKYGAVTDAQGRFTFSFPAEWKPVRGGELRISVVPVGYTFKPLRRRLDWRTYDPAHPLVLRLASAPGRGRPNLRGFRLMTPPAPPPVYPARAHSIRP